MIIRLFTLSAIFVIVLSQTSLVYASPQQDPQTAFDNAEYVVIGKILSVEILSVPYTDPSVPVGIALYEIDVEEYLKNPSDVDIIQVPGTYVNELNPRGTNDLIYEVNQRVLLYIQKDYPDTLPGYDLIIRDHESRVLDDSVCDREATYQNGLCVATTYAVSIENINNGYYVVSESISPNLSADKIVFHDVEFSMPYNLDPPSHTYSDVMFPDGTKETLDMLFDEPSFSEYAQPQVGFVGKSDGYVFFVSINLKEFSLLKQYKMGLKFENLKCKENFILIQKYNGLPACVNPDTRKKLIERGWTVN